MEHPGLGPDIVSEPSHPPNIFFQGDLIRYIFAKEKKMNFHYIGLNANLQKFPNIEMISKTQKSIYPTKNNYWQAMIGFKIFISKDLQLGQIVDETENLELRFLQKGILHQS